MRCASWPELLFALPPQGGGRHGAVELERCAGGGRKDQGQSHLSLAEARLTPAPLTPLSHFLGADKA